MKEAYELVEGAGPLLLSCEHASNRLPSPWSWHDDDGWLVDTHWAFDIGVAELTRALAGRIRAPALLARFSRLLVDPNRPPDSPTLFRQSADGRSVRLNTTIDADERAARLSYYQAYHDRLGALTKDSAILLAIHSFTDVYEGEPRDFDMGVLYDEEEELAASFAAALAPVGRVRMNEPYSGKKGMIYAAHRHATVHGKRAIEIEVRQDRLGDAGFVAALVSAMATWRAGL